MRAAWCRFTADDQVAFAYQEMEPEAAIEFEAHLACCPSCRAAVEELKNFRALSAWVRAREVPILSYRNPYARLGRGGPRLTLWVPLAAAAVTLLVVLLVSGRNPVAQGPGSARPEASAPQESVSIASAAGILPQGTSGGLGPVHRGRAGDTVRTTDLDPTDLTLPDGSRLRLGVRSRLRIESVSARRDAFVLEEGTLLCDVVPRPDGRRLQVLAGPGRVTVKGTRFGVVLEGGELGLDVEDGVVEITALAQLDAPVLVHAGQRAKLREGGPIRLEERIVAARTDPAPEPPKRASVPARKPKTSRPSPVQASPLATPVASSAGPPVQVIPGKPSAEPPVALETVSVEDGWIFDEIRREIDRGDPAGALAKLDNYLLDPSSPDREEATYQRARCLEFLGRLPEAAAGYQSVRERWPQGRRAREAERALLRTVPGP